jgi:hypothetical protein
MIEKPIPFSWSISRPSICNALLVLLLLNIPLAAFPDHALSSIFKIIIPSLSFGLVPGYWLFSLTGMDRRFSFWELMGLSFALSLALLQIPTMLALILHLSSGEVLSGFLGVLLLLGLGLCLSRDYLKRAGPIKLDALDLGLGLLLCLMATMMYLQGESITLSDEALYHISIIKQLSFLSSPRIDNFYYIPDYQYTHPFPSIQYFMALVSRTGDIDAFFVYQKMRYLWAMQSLLYIFLAVKLIFQSKSLALFSSLVAAILAAAGLYAGISGIFMAQVVPYSHPSDVAMNVHLPALIVLSLYFFTSSPKSQSYFLGLATAALSMVIVIIHIRESVQYLTYLGCLLLVLLFAPSYRRQMGPRLLFIMGITIGAALIYTRFHQQVVPDVAEIDASIQAEAWARLLEDPWGQVFHGTYLESRHYQYTMTLRGVVLFLFLLGPSLYYYRQQVFVWMIGGVFLAYLLLLNSWLLASVYIRLSYFEILLSPLRNLNFFLYLMTGPIIYMLVQGLDSLIPKAYFKLGLVGLSLALAASTLYLNQVLQVNSPSPLALGVFFRGLLLVYLVGIGLILWQHHQGRLALLPSHFEAQPRFLLYGLAFTLLYAGLTLNTQNSPLKLPPLILEPQDYYAQNVTCGQVGGYLGALGLEERDQALSQVCFPPAELIHFLEQTLQEDELIFHNQLTVYPLIPYLPAKTVTWPPPLTIHLISPETVFQDYYRYYTAYERFGFQPFFNPLLDFDARRDFLTSLAIDYLIVEPIYRPWLEPILALSPPIFEPIYEQADWLVYRVHGRAELWEAIPSDYQAKIPLSALAAYSDYQASLSQPAKVFIPGQQSDPQALGLEAYVAFENFKPLEAASPADYVEVAYWLARASNEAELDQTSSIQAAYDQWKADKSACALAAMGYTHLWAERVWLSYLSAGEIATLSDAGQYQKLASDNMFLEALGHQLYAVQCPRP